MLIWNTNWKFCLFIRSVNFIVSLPARLPHRCLDWIRPHSNKHIYQNNKYKFICNDLLNWFHEDQKTHLTLQRVQDASYAMQLLAFSNYQSILEDRNTFTCSRIAEWVCNLFEQSQPQPEWRTGTKKQAIMESEKRQVLRGKKGRCRNQEAVMVQAHTLLWERKRKKKQWELLWQGYRQCCLELKLKAVWCLIGEDSLES